MVRRGIIAADYVYKGACPDGNETRFDEVFGSGVLRSAVGAAVEARRQTGSSASSAAASANSFSSMTMGMGFMPLPGMFGSASPSATDAAALGAAVPQGGMMGTGGNNMFMNPMAAPFLYGSMFPMTPQQQGMMMLAGQRKCWE